MTGPQRSASLPMYNLPAMRDANVAFWDALAALLRDAGVSAVPGTLLPDDAPVPDTIGAGMLFTQVCGYPLQTIYRGQYAVVGVPDYDVPGYDIPGDDKPCGGTEIGGPTHRAVFVVRTDDPARSLRDLRGRVFACNSLHSNTGMNLPRRTLAPVADGRPFFARITVTGAHAASMALVQAGGADAAAIDTVTLAFHAEYRPQALHGLRILAPTVLSPTIPFVTAVATTASESAALQQALAQIGADPRYATVRRGLRLRTISPPDGSDYGVLLRYEQEASALGYPSLA